MPVQLQVFTKRRAFSSVLICKIMRRKIKTLYIFGRRRSVITFFIIFIVSMLSVCRWLAQIGSRALLLPSPPDQNLEHLRRNRSLKYYIDKTQLLIEPSSTPCDGVEEVPILVLVTSPPARFEQRSVIRSTWAKYQPTYFVMGLDGPTVDEQLVDNYVEAKQYGDLVIFDFQEHYHNLSLKTALMLQWTLDRCPQVEFLLKTDDDVFVNPWMLKQVVKDNKDAQLLGEYISKILKAAFTVPLVNLEDIYFSYLVAKKYLHLTLFHDRRLSPQKPCFLIACVYWHLATAHSVSPAELANVWPKIETIANEFRQHEDVCKYYEILSSDLFLY
ncbi:beta-1,3-galactosyltransferase 5-like isoform X3 [Galleria mellonella]|uniref:Hexosyltransferase n=1 Tax=Galleria mellonella TaxID=7137 RepID=A0ABM3MWV2_GALME|nr:beta-1,3-galactosyltransferase 5-like isoform X3 [Galleria mellonella]